MTRFEICLPRILKHEGGYVNHPRDPGGATNKGVIQRTYDSYNRQHGRPRKPVKQITDAEVAAIYEANYWKPTGGKLPIGMDYVAFDAGVNSGPRQGNKWLQRALKVSADGKIGPQTIAAAEGHGNPTQVVKDACGRRMAFLRGLRHWGTFKKGWTRRVTEVEAVATDDILKGKKVTKTTRRKHAQEESQKAVKRKKNADKTAGGAAAGGVAGGGGTLASADPVMLIILGIGIGVLVCVAIYMVRKSQIEKARSEAYSNVAKEIE